MSFNLYLTVHEIEQLPQEKLEELNINSLNLKIQWIGDGKKHGFFSKRLKRSRTSKQQIQNKGIVRWNEEFEHVVNLKRNNSGGFRSWSINLQVQGINRKMKGKELIFAEAKIDITEYFPADNEMNMRIPLNFKIGDHSSKAILQVKLQTTELQSKERSVFNLARAFTLQSFSLNQRHFTENPRRNQRGSRSSKHAFIAARSNNNQSFTDSSSDDEPEFGYKKLKMTNILLDDQLACNIEELKYEREINHPKLPVNYKQETPLLRFFSWNKARLSFKMSFKKINISRGVPLLNKACGELGGDDIDIERQCLGHSKRTKVHPEEEAKEIGFEDEDQFKIGNWEKKRIISRDGEMELSTDIFFASIDQRSEKADGGSACTVLTTIIADWMHKNPNSLPLRCQFDQLVREGSSEWRKLCEDENHKENFSDLHFDLDTVIKAKIRSIIEIVENSYIGFFGLDDIEYLQEVRSFDSIWNELLRNNEFEERVYIASWNDHFFVLKMEKSAIYLIDTLGERLYEGCNQAYILKFSEESVICKKRDTSGSQNGESNGESNNAKDSSDSQKGESNCESNNAKESSDSQKGESNGENNSVKDSSDSQKGESNDENNNAEDSSDSQKGESKGESNNVEDSSDSQKGASNSESNNAEDSSNFQKADSHDESYNVESRRLNEGNRSSEEIICEGMKCCKEYIKGFLAAIPLRGLQEDIRKGFKEENTLHKRLQIEFHFIAPCATESSIG